MLEDKLFWNVNYIEIVIYIENAEMESRTVFKQTQLDTTGHNWTQLDTTGHNWTQVDTNGI